MNTKEFKKALTTQTENTIFLQWTDTNDMKRFLKVAYEMGYKFVCKENYNINQKSEKLKEEIESDFYSFYHKNSKIVLMFFKNSITSTKDIQFTTRSVKNTYPQLKNEPIHYPIAEI